MRFVAGQTILDRYVLERVMAVGGMGTVWTAIDADGTPVAVKLVDDATHDPSLVIRLAREAALLARVRHPHVVAMLDHGVVDGQPVLVLELVAGRTLEVVLHERGAVARSLAVTWTEQILAGLGALHAAQVVHRDVKPGNVVVAVEEDFVLKLIDLGVARSLRAGTGRITRDGRTVGSLDYMAPEQMTDAEVDARADIYAAGIVLYEMVAGHRPSSGLRGAMIRMRIPVTPPEAPPHLPPLPPALVDAIMAMLALRPDDRPATAAAAAAALSEAAALLE